MISDQVRVTLEGWLSSGDRIGVYQNHALDSASAGNIIYLRIKANDTPPKHAPDGSWGTGWKYIFIREILDLKEIDDFVSKLES